MDCLINFQDSKMLHFQYLFNLMQRYRGSIKFFDIRTAFEYESKHIYLSINILAEDFSLDKAKLSTLLNEKNLSRLRRFCIIIGYQKEYERTSETLREILESLKCREIHMLEDLNFFIEKYSFLCLNRGIHTVTDFPNEIIPKLLYLGSQDHAHNREIIEILGITHVLNVTRGAANLFPGLKYCRVHVDDLETEKISLYFQKAYEFIENALLENSSGKKNILLVHCAKGVSRSATIVIMYIMRSSGLSLAETLAFVKRNREIIEPNEGFMKELRRFEDSHNQFARCQTAKNFTKNFKKELRML